MEIKYKIWIEKNGKVIFGTGRNKILKALEVQHSLHAATLELQMSYRAAWGRLKASEERMGKKLVDISFKKKSMHLTKEARAIIDRFEMLEKDMERLLQTANQDFEILTKKNEIISDACES